MVVLAEVGIGPLSILNTSHDGRHMFCSTELQRMIRR
jgi:hypothetical protein